MLYNALLLAVLAIVAGMLGFFTLSGALAWVAKALLIVFLILFVLSLFQRPNRNLTG
jgi:uncharacterized membrane protein YtjA (UPF0391 family)